MSLFEHYPASPESIYAAAAAAGAAGQRCYQVGTQVRDTGRHASNHVEGDITAALRSAPDPVLATSHQLDQSALIARGCLNRWGTCVTSHNAAIDDLNRRWMSAQAAGFGIDQEPHLAPSDTKTPAQQQADYDRAVSSAADALRAQLLREKQQRDADLDTQGTDIATMLDEGPTPRVITMLANSEELPPGYWEDLRDRVWELFKQGLIRQVVPPSNGSPYDVGVWATIRLLIGVWALSDWKTVYSYGYFLPPGVDPDKTLSLTHFRRGVLAMKPDSWTRHPDHPISFGRWSKVGRYAKWTLIPLVAGLAAMDRWQRDADRPDLSTTHKVFRAATVAFMTGAGVWAGGLYGGRAGWGAGFAAGGRLGQTLGGAVGREKGAIIGSGVGAFVGILAVSTVGAVGGSSAGTALTEDIDQWEGAISEVVEPMEYAPGETKETERLERIRDFARPLLTSLAPPPPTPPRLPEHLPPLPSAPDQMHPLPIEVMNGDSLWRISERQLAPAATDHDIQQTVDALHRLNAGIIGPDPDLIFSGTQLNVPNGTP